MYGNIEVCFRRIYMIEFIYDNVQWIFSGIGVVVLTSVVGYIFNKRKKKGKSIIVKNSQRVKVKDNMNEEINVSRSKDVTIEGNKDAEG